MMVVNILILILFVSFSKGASGKIFVLAMGMPVLTTFALLQDMDLMGIISLNNGYQKYASEGFIVTATLFLIFYIIFGRSKPLQYIPTINYGFRGRLVFLFLFIISICLAYPEAVLHIGSERFGSFGGIAWGVFVVFNGFIFVISSYGKSKNLLTYIFLIFCFYVIYSGERVELLFLVILQSIYISRGRVLSFNIKTTRAYINITLGLSLFIYVMYKGYERIGASFDVSVVFGFMYNLSTLTDVVHVFMSSVSYVNNYSYYPEASLSTILSFLPSSLINKCQYDYSCMLNNYIPNVSGGLFYTQGYLSLGLLGATIQVALIGLILRFLRQSRSIVLNCCYLILFVLSLRLLWYGVDYTIKPFLLTIGYCFLCRKIGILSLKKIERGL